MKSYLNIKSCRHENLIYLTVWGMLFLVPILTAHVRATYNSCFSFDWGEVFIVWRLLAVYFLLFVLHNFLLVPLVYHKRKIVLYFSAVIIFTTAFAICQYNHKPKGEGKKRQWNNVHSRLQVLRLRYPKCTRHYHHRILWMFAI